MFCLYIVTGRRNPTNFSFWRGEFTAANRVAWAGFLPKTPVAALIFTDE